MDFPVQVFVGANQSGTWDSALPNFIDQSGSGNGDFRNSLEIWNCPQNPNRKTAGGGINR